MSDELRTGAELLASLSDAARYVREFEDEHIALMERFLTAADERAEESGNGLLRDMVEIHRRTLTGMLAFREAINALHPETAHALDMYFEYRAVREGR